MPMPLSINCSGMSLFCNYQRLFPTNVVSDSLSLFPIRTVVSVDGISPHFPFVRIETELQFFLKPVMSR